MNIFEYLKQSIDVCSDLHSGVLEVAVANCYAACFIRYGVTKSLFFSLVFYVRDDSFVLRFIRADQMPIPLWKGTEKY